MGRQIGVHVSPETVGYGFLMNRTGNVVINENAHVGNNITCAGMNCVGVDDISGLNS